LAATVLLSDADALDAENAAHLQSLGPGLSQLAASLGGVPSMQLFQEWVPQRGAPLAELSVPAKAAFSDGKKGDDVASRALEDSSNTHWTSSPGKNHAWGIAFDTATVVSSMHVEFRVGCFPETVELEVQFMKPGGGSTDWKSIKRVPSKGGTEVLSLPLPPEPLYKLRLKMTTTSSSEDCSIVRARFWAPRPAESYVSSRAALEQLTTWLSGVVDGVLRAPVEGKASAAAADEGSQVATPTPGATMDAAIRVLTGLARTTGSLAALLALCRGCVRIHSTCRPELALSDATAQAGEALVTALRTRTAAERATQSRLEYSSPVVAAYNVPGLGTSGGGGGSAAGWGPLTTACFDPDASTPQLTFTKDDRTVASGGGGAQQQHALVTPYGTRGGPGFTAGKAAWEFRLDEDTTSQASQPSVHMWRYDCCHHLVVQCSCFGAATKPVESSAYDTSKSLWMYRAYNGTYCGWLDKRRRIQPAHLQVIATTRAGK
jgi:hypothetical protein